MTEDMTPLSQPLSEFDKPPINEVVCGILFNPIKGFRVSHFGALWNQFKSEFPKCEDHSPIVPIPEDELGNLNLFPLPRIWFVEERGNRLIQVQRNRFLHNWRKRRSYDQYPGYDSVIEDFEKYLACFKEFLTEEELGSLDPRRYEMTYIDHIPKGEGWETLSDIGDVFPSFVLPRNDDLLKHNIRGIDWKTVFVLPDEESQIQISIQSVKSIKDNQPVLRLDFTAHGQVDSEQHTSMRNWFDYVHNWIHQLFGDLISVEIQEKFWGRKSC